MNDQQKKKITDHHDGHGLNELIEIVPDERDPNNGGASHFYSLGIGESAESAELKLVGELQFQHGPRGEPGSQPGLTDAAVIAVVLDRYRGFQAGPYACRENALVITKLEESLHWMKHRADARAQRGVLGKNEA